jgi:GST-like protein
MMTLYGTAGSGSAAMELALGRCGAPWRLVRASSWETDSAQAELRALNALAQIPTLQLDDGTVLSESAAILIHLGLAFPGAGLLPADAPARARALRGLVYIAANCYAAIGVIDFPERWIEDDGAGVFDRLRAGARRRLHLQWEVFADQFGGEIAAPGQTPAALDFLAAVVSRWSGARAHLKAQRPALHAQLLAVEAHADCAEVFARHWPQ